MIPNGDDCRLPILLSVWVPPHMAKGASFAGEMWVVVPLAPAALAGLLNDVKERLDDIDRHRKDDRGILFGADLRQRLQVAQLHCGRNAKAISSGARISPAVEGKAENSAPLRTVDLMISRYRRHCGRLGIPQGSVPSSPFD